MEIHHNRRSVCLWYRLAYTSVKEWNVIENWMVEQQPSLVSIKRDMRYQTARLLSYIACARVQLGGLITLFAVSARLGDDKSALTTWSIFSAPVENQLYLMENRRVTIGEKGENGNRKVGSKCSECYFICLADLFPPLLLAHSSLSLLLAKLSLCSIRNVAQHDLTFLLPHIFFLLLRKHIGKRRWKRWGKSVKCDTGRKAQSDQVKFALSSIA